LRDNLFENIDQSLSATIRFDRLLRAINDRVELEQRSPMLPYRPKLNTMSTEAAQRLPDLRQRNIPDGRRHLRLFGCRRSRVHSS
jgi:hypothetical protein